MDDETYPDAQFSSEFSETEDTSTPNTDNPALTALAPPPTSMNKNTLPIAQFNSESTVHGGGFAPNAGAFFTSSRDFVVKGGVFTSQTHIHNVSPALLPDFEVIPLGHLDLCNEICLDSSSDTVYRKYEHRSVRKVYSARIHGCRSNMTVAVYQGDNAEEEWRQDISKYSGLRHPNLIQLFGTVSSSGLHAAVYHDDLVPAIQMLNKYRDTPIGIVNLWAYIESEFKNAEKYVKSVSGRDFRATERTIWIRPSTGRLCVELAGHLSNPLLFIHESNLPSGTILSPLEPRPDSEIIASMSVDNYHQICRLYLSQDRFFSTSTYQSVKLGIYHCTSGTQFNDAVEIAWCPECALNDSDWLTERSSTTRNGWTRVDSCKAAGKSIRRIVYSSVGLCKYWLAQANYIFGRLNITSDHADYILVDRIIYSMKIPGSRHSVPPGYLFLCPFQDLQSNIPGQSVVAERAVYWSLNPSGVERLSTDEARDLGFPAVELETDVYGHSWNGNVYVGLHQFHRGKGFDPDSQELAQHLGYPLYQLSEQLEGPFAHVASEEETFGGLNYVESNPTLPRDSAQISGLSIELEGCPATDIAMIGAEMPEPFQFDAEMPTALSWAWKLVTAVKLMLMTYLAISWVYERVQEVVQGGM